MGRIRSRLFWTLILPLAGLLVAVAVFWRFYIEPAFRMDVAKNQQEVARRAADQIRQFIEERTRGLIAAAEIGHVWKADKKHHKEVLYQLLRLDRQINEVSVVDASGQEHIRLSRLRVYTDADLISLAGEESFRQAIQGKVYVSDVYYARTAEPLITVGVPIKFTAREITGILVAEASLKKLWDSIAHIKVGKTGQAFVVDRKGNLIAHPDYSKILLGMNLSHLNEVKEFLTHPDLDPDLGEVVIGQDGKRVMSAFARVEGLDWAVVVEEPVESALAEVRQIERLTILLFILIAVGTFVVSYFFSGRIAGPVRRLEQGAKLIAEGNLEHKLDIHTGDEIESLASEFNRMAQALKASYQGLEAKVAERTQEITALYSALAPLAPADSTEDMPKGVIERVLEVTGADAGLIRIVDRTTSSFVYLAQIGFPSNYLETTQHLQEESAIGLAFRTGEPVIAADIAEDLRLKGKRQLEAGFVSCAFLPLRVKGELRGIIHLASRQMGHFSEEKKGHLMAIARQMGIAMENSELFEETRHQLERVQAFGEIERAISSTLDLHAVLDVLLEKIDLVLPYAATTVRLFNTKTGLLEPVACRNLDEEEWKAEQWRAGRGIPNVVFDTKAPVMISNVQKDRRTRDPEFFRKHGLISYLGVPLVAKDEILGVISFYTKEEHEFTKQEIDFLAALAGQAAIAIQNARLHEETKRRRREAEELARVAKSLTETLDMTAVADRVVTSVREILDVKTSTLRLLQSDGSLRTLASRGQVSPRSPGGGDTVPPGMGLTSRAIAEGRPVWSADMLNDPKVRLTDQMRDSQLRTGNSSMIAVPLRAHEKIIGALALSDQKGRIYSESEVALVQTFADQGALALENARLFEETERNLKGIRTLREIDKAITSTLDLHTVLDALLERIDLLLPYAVTTTVRLFNRESGVLEALACRNLDEADWKAGKWVGRHGASNLVFKSKEPLTIRNVQTDPRIRDQEFFARHGLISYLGVPLTVRGEILGVLGFYTKKEHEFSGQEVELLSTLAGQAAIAIHNSEVYEELAKLASDLSRANQVKDEFLSVMSHELRTPLNVVMGYTGMIKDGLLGEINPEQEKALEKVISRARDQLTMISGILQAVQMEAEGVKVEPHEVNLEEFLDDLKLNYALASGKELNIVWDYPPDLPAINTDTEKLKHILHNLINNAVKFTERGAVTISARFLPVSDSPVPRIGEGVNRGRGVVEFKVSDTGLGIAKEHLSMIFERFRQVDSSETRKYGGVGIGLYIVKKLTEMLGGKIDVESEVGKGSTFTVTIPVATHQQAGKEEAKGLILPT